MQAVVIDTNVIISAALTSNGNPRRIMDLVSDGVLSLFYSDEILNEYIEVLSRSKFKFQEEKQQIYVNKIREVGTWVAISGDPSSKTQLFADESDRIFYDVAVTHNAVLITGNKRHYPDELFIMTPSEFFSLYD